MTAFVVGLALLSGPSSPALHNPPSAPPKPVLRAGRARLVMARGSYCWSSPPVGLCVDTRAPVTRRALPVRRDGDVRIDMRTGVTLVGASIRRGHRDLPVASIRRSKRHFVVVLPHDLTRRAVLDLIARYPQGDGSFGARLRLRR